MRISDWSSDVCSSDLGLGKETSAGSVRRLFLGLGRAADGDRRLGVHRHQIVGAGDEGDRVDRLAVDAHFIMQMAARRAAGRAHEADQLAAMDIRSEEHTSELQSLMRIPYAVFCMKKKNFHVSI